MIVAKSSKNMLNRFSVLTPLVYQSMLIVMSNLKKPGYKP